MKEEGAVFLAYADVRRETERAVSNAVRHRLVSLNCLEPRRSIHPGTVDSSGQESSVACQEVS